MTSPSQDQDLRTALEPDHELKSHPDVFWPAARGEKTFEFRKDDRPGGFHLGQTVRLRCYDPDHGYHGHSPLDRRITNILRGGEFGLQDGFCVLSLAPLTVPPRLDHAGGVGEDDITQAMIQAGRHAANLNDGTLASIYLAMANASPAQEPDKAANRGVVERAWKDGAYWAQAEAGNADAWLMVGALAEHYALGVIGKDAAQAPDKAGEREGVEKPKLWCMHILGPDDVHAAPDFWTALAWASEMNAFLSKQAAKENWAADDNYPHTQAVVAEWPWSPQEHCDCLIKELAERTAHQASRDKAALAPQPNGTEASRGEGAEVQTKPCDDGNCRHIPDCFRASRCLATPTPPLSPDSTGPAGDAWDGATLETRLRSYPAAPPGSDALSCGYVSALMTEAADALTPSAPIAAPVRDDGARELPRLTDRMIRAACKGHYGDDNIDGIDLTVAGVNWSFRQGFQRMWTGIRKELRASLPAPAGDVPGEAQTQEGGR